jgi:acetylornithine deacetylase/succinyl-diaminopimelate desuccinylase-like protein
LIELFRTSDPQYGAPTCTIGTIHGGARTNVIPDLCESTLDIRLPPGILPEEVLVAFQEHMAALGIRGEAEAEEVGFPAYLTQPEDPVARSAIAALDVLGLPTETGLAPYWSDLAYLKIAGVPAIVLGPGSILRAHSGDEYVEIDQLKQAAKIYALMAINYCGSPS